MIIFRNVFAHRAPMPRRAAPCVVALATAVCCGSVSAAGPDFKISGFGTLAAVHSSDANSDFLAARGQPNGAGLSSPWSFTPDSKLGVQINAVFTDKISAVLQVVSQHQSDNSFTPEVEWANLKYQVTPEFSVRAGRIAAPSFLMSESRFVGYANPAVRQSTEVYSQLPITSNDGLDATYRTSFNGVNNTTQAYYGTSTAGIPNGGQAKSKATWGLNDTVEVGSLTLRAGYNSFNFDISVPATEALFNGLRKFSAGAGAVPAPAFQSASAQALALADKYNLHQFKSSAVSLGASYDPGNWFATGEFLWYKSEGVLSNSVSWYTIAGYRFGKFTPYAGFSIIRSLIKDEPGIVGAPAPIAAAAAGLSAGVNGIIHGVNGSQHTTSAGVRWDFMNNFALKAQYDRIRPDEGSNGRLAAAPGTLAARTVNLATVALDFVF